MAKKSRDASASAEKDRRIITFFARNPDGTVAEAGASIGLGHAAAQARVVKLRKNRRMKRVVRVADTGLDQWCLVTFPVDTDGVTAHIKQRCEKQPQFDCNLAMVGVWDNMNGSLDHSGKQTDGVTLLVRVTSMVVAKQLQDFLQTLPGVCMPVLTISLASHYIGL